MKIKTTVYLLLCSFIFSMPLSGEGRARSDDKPPVNKCVGDTSHFYLFAEDAPVIVYCFDRDKETSSASEFIHHDDQIAFARKVGIVVVKKADDFNTRTFHTGTEQDAIVVHQYETMDTMKVAAFILKDMGINHPSLMTLMGRVGAKGDFHQVDGAERGQPEVKDLRAELRTLIKELMEREQLIGEMTEARQSGILARESYLFRKYQDFRQNAVHTEINDVFREAYGR